MGSALLYIFDAVIQLAIFAVIISAIMSWLIAFDVINVRNRFVYQVVRTLEAVTDPMLRPIRRVIPLMGGIDLSPIVLILLLNGLQIAVHKLVGPTLVDVLR